MRSVYESPSDWALGGRRDLFPIFKLPQLFEQLIHGAEAVDAPMLGQDQDDRAQQADPEVEPVQTPADKEDIKAEVKEIQETVTEAVQKNETVDERFLSCRFRNIARMAPDVLDVVVATLLNPLAGLGMAVN